MISQIPSEGRGMCWVLLRASGWVNKKSRFDFDNYTKGSLCVQYHFVVNLGIREVSLQERGYSNKRQKVE